MLNTTRAEKKAARSFETYLMTFAVKLSRYIRMDEYRKHRLKNVLKATGMNMEPEVYQAYALVKSGVILLLAREGFESEEIADLAGLNQRSPLYAGVMAVCLFSMAGIPPLVGFYAKLSVLQALVASGQGLYIALAVFAVLMSLIGAFYYLRVVKVMYFDAPLTATSVSAPLDVRVVLTVNGALVLVLGLLPGGLMALCADAIVRALAT